MTKKIKQKPELEQILDCLGEFWNKDSIKLSHFTSVEKLGELCLIIANVTSAFVKITKQNCEVVNLATSLPNESFSFLFKAENGKFYLLSIPVINQNDSYGLEQTWLAISDISFVEVKEQQEIKIKYVAV